MIEDLKLKATTSYIVEQLMDQYGPSMTLGRLYSLISHDHMYKCPKCEGRGYLTVEYNKYPNNLPDSGFVYEKGFKDVECDLCKGKGFTPKLMKPKIVQDGWEAED